MKEYNDKDKTANYIMCIRKVVLDREDTLSIEYLIIKAIAHDTDIPMIRESNNTEEMDYDVRIH